MLKRSVLVLMVLAIVIFGAASFTYAQDPTPEPPGRNGARDGSGPIMMLNAAENLGEAWTGTGTITAVDYWGITLELEDGTVVYVELGPSFYWAEQGVTLAVGDVVTVVGYFDGEVYRAATVTLADGTVLTLRNEDGQPLWSGGIMNGRYGTCVDQEDCPNGMMNNHQNMCQNNCDAADDQQGGVTDNSQDGMMGGPHHDDDDNNGHHHMGR